MIYWFVMDDDRRLQPELMDRVLEGISHVLWLGSFGLLSVYNISSVIKEVENGATWME